MRLIYICLNTFFWDSFCSLQPLMPARRHVIRPAAKWSGASHNPIKVVSQSSASSGVSTLDPVPACAPSTSRDAKGTTSPQAAIKVQFPAHSSTSGNTLLDLGPSSLSQPKPTINSQQHNGTSADTSGELHAISSVHTPSTSTNAKANTISSRIPAQVPEQMLVQPQPSTSGLAHPQPGSSAQLRLEHHANSSASATHYISAAAVTASSSSTKTQVKASTSSLTQDNPQASTSSAHPPSRIRTHPQPSTSLFQSGGTVPVQPHLIQLKEVKLVVLPPQPNQASALITQPQGLLQPVPVTRMRGNLIQIEPQPLAQAPAQAAAQPPQPPQVIPGMPPAVLIAAAPERLGPPEAGHRIILGSQAPKNALPNPPAQAGPSGLLQPANRLNIRVPGVNSNPPPAPPAPPAPAASVPHNREEARLILGQNPERLNLVAVPPAPEDIPQIEDARPGPSAQQERPEHQPHVRALINGVVSISLRKLFASLLSVIKLNECNCAVLSHISSVPTPFFFPAMLSSTF